MEQRAQRVDEIEVLRAVAILFTLFHHLPGYLFLLPNPFFDAVFKYAWFWSGVDLFLVISGFVIMQSFMRLRLDRASFWKSSAVFWLRRIFRIWPSAWLWLGVYLLLTLYFNSSGAFGNIEQNIRDSVAAFLQYANFYGLGCAGKCGPNQIYWSLSLEEQFYILFPFLIYFSGRYLKQVLAILILVQFFFLNRFAWTLGWTFRLDALMWGMLLALVFKETFYQRLAPEIFLRVPLLKWLTLILLIVILALLPGIWWDVPVSTGLIALVSAALVFIASFDRGYLMKPNPLRKIFVYIGSRSYSLYLIHILAYRGAHETLFQVLGFQANPENSWTVALLAFPLLFGFAELNYRLIETPLRKWGHRLTSRTQ